MINRERPGKYHKSKGRAILGIFLPSLTIAQFVFCLKFCDYIISTFIYFPFFTPGDNPGLVFPVSKTIFDCGIPPRLTQANVFSKSKRSTSLSGSNSFS